LVDFYEIRQGGYATEGDLDAIFRSFNHYKMADDQTSELDAELEPVSVVPLRVKFVYHFHVHVEGFKL
jgi:hypothetical protein